MTDPTPQHDPLARTLAPQQWHRLATTLTPDVDDATLDAAIMPIIAAATTSLVEDVPVEDAVILAPELGLLRALGNYVAACARMIRTRPDPLDPLSLITSLLMLNKLALQRTWEVESLLRAGLDIGAVIAARPLYETSTKAALLRRHHGAAKCEHLADQYLASSMIETKNNARTHNRTWGQHGHPYDQETLAVIERVASEQIQLAKAQGNPMVAKTNGWAAPLNDGKPPTLARMAELAGTDDHQLAYAHGSHHIHANAYAAIMNADPPGGPDIYGPPDEHPMRGAAGRYAALGLTRTCVALIGEPTTDTEIRARMVLLILSERTEQAFNDA